MRRGEAGGLTEMDELRGRRPFGSAACLALARSSSERRDECGQVEGRGCAAERTLPSRDSARRRTTEARDRPTAAIALERSTRQVEARDSAREQKDALP
jgi:hypothetical protein